jgi:serine/threonine protein kinase/tetratricopeptide (TPR) repeat protein
MTGQSLSHYRIIAKLGEGGMGAVYEAEDTRLGRRIALKLLPEHLAAKPGVLERFKREARALAALNHPNIVTIHSVEEAAGRHFLTMERVQGRPLNELIPPGGLSLEKLFTYSIPLADALAAAHQHGIAHRDLKPSNIMVNAQGRLKVIDFGLAKLFEADRGTADPEGQTRVAATVLGQIIGTPAYMSPEQIEGRPLDQRTDIFSLGILLCEMATGQRPFKGDTAMAIMTSILRDAPSQLSALNPEMPEHLGRIARHCLQKDPDERYQSALDVRNELKALQDETTSAQKHALAVPGEAPHRLKNLSTTERIAPPSAMAGSPHSFHTSRRWPLVSMALILLTTFGTALYWFKFHPGKDSGSRPSGGRPIESVAVLPFKNFVTDENKLHFADLLTEEIIGKLGEMSAIKNSALQRVISVPMMMTYKGTTLSPRAIAQQLNVDSLVAGSLTLIGTQATIHVQLIETARDRPIWSTNYVGDVDHIVQLRNEMALGISRAIQLVLTPEEQSRLTSARQVDPRALEAYTRGKYSGGTDEESLAAIRLFEEAVRIAPDFAAGHAALAGAYVDRYYRLVPQEHKQWEEKAFLALDRALKLDPDSAEARTTLGEALWTPFKNFQHEEAMIEFQRAAKSNPNSSDAHCRIAMVYVHTGLLDEALVHDLRAAELNRLANRPLVGQALAFLCRSEYEQSLRFLRKASQNTMPSVIGSHTAWAQFGLRQTNAAAATLRSFLKEFPEDRSGELTAMNAVLLAFAGDPAGAQQEIQTAKLKDTGFGEFHHTTYFIAVACAAMNLREESLSWLEKTADTGFPCYPLFAKDPNLDNLRGTPGFVSFLNAQKKQWQERKDTWLKSDDLVKASLAR